MNFIILIMFFFYIMISGQLNDPDVFDYLWKNKDHHVIDPRIWLFLMFSRGSIPFLDGVTSIVLDNT